MKLIKLIPTVILALVLSMTIVQAAHVPQVLLNPSEWAANTEKDLSFSIKNSGDSIVKVELIVPEDSNQNPVYVIGEIGRPAGWTYQTYTRTSGQSSPYKIVWSSSSGLSNGDSVDFGFTAKSPSSGQYQWSWTTTDVNDGKFPGTSTTKVSMALVSNFQMSGVPQSAQAGNSFRITVKVIGQDGSVKTDYSGTVSFTSSDPKAILPKNYAFVASDRGSKDFLVTYKTAGDQTLTITDWSSKITQKSAVTKVTISNPVALSIEPKNSEANPGDKITLNAFAKDRFDNLLDVTSDTKWSIDKEAGGSWNMNSYTTGNEGLWTVVGTYNTLVGGTSLTVKTGAVTPTPTPTPIPTPTPTPTPTPIPNVTPTPTNLEEMNIEVQDSVSVAPGSNETFILTVNNVGTNDLSDVSVSASNVTSDWVTIYPSKITIAAGTSRDYLIVVSVPANTAESGSIEFVASSAEGVTTSKTVELQVSTAPTGFLSGISKNLLNLGIVIVAVAALVLIAWELWFRKSK